MNLPRHSLQRAGCRLRRLILALIFAGASPLVDAAAPSAASIPFSQLGATAQEQYSGEGMGITPTATGARMRAVLQDLEGEATPEGLWLISTADEDMDKPNRFRLSAASVDRETPVRLASKGIVQVGEELVSWVRPGLVEEYRVSGDGVRQDFVVLERPAGEGELSVVMELTGGRAEAADYGAKLTIEATGRELAYHRLHVSDAAGRELGARMEVLDSGRLAVRVDDTEAVYPVRIDPTFSDADWIVLNPDAPGVNVNGEVNALAVDGSGNLYAGGWFITAGGIEVNRVAKWNGSTWSALGAGMNSGVYALAVDGSGNLYAGGMFSTAGGIEVNRIAKWNGSTWSALGAGMNNSVSTLVVDGGGNLYAGGEFSTAGGVNANRVAKWNGSTWSALGAGMNNGVSALAVDGSGNLYAGGEFTTAGGANANRVAKWNGSIWSGLGSGMNNSISALAVDGGGNLYAGGRFTTAGGVEARRIAKWNGNAWSALGSGISGSGVWDFVHALVVDGSGNLYAGGTFSGSCAKWNGSSWSALGSDSGMNDGVAALTVDGSGNLYVGGGFSMAGGVEASRIAKWNGSSWSALGAGLSGRVYALAVDGGGNLYAGGEFDMAGGVDAHRIAMWNGSTWSALGSGMWWDNWIEYVYALAVDGGGNLYAGGRFLWAGDEFAQYIAMWNGSTWSPLGSGMGVKAGEWYAVGEVYALAVDGGGNLYAGGEFTTADGLGANRIAKWNGSAWSALGAGMNNNVYALAVDDGGNLYAGGTFTTAGGVEANNIAKWNGSSWSALGSGMNNNVYALAVDGGGNLYAGGAFTTAGGMEAKRIAKWNGSSWATLRAGMDGKVSALAMDGSGNLYVGGWFAKAGTKISPYIVQANLAGRTDTDKDGLSDDLEWALGLDPHAPDTPPVTFEHTGSSLEYTYSRSVTAVQAGATFEVEWHDDLQIGSWSAEGVIPEVISDNGLIQHVKATMPPGAAGRRFVRIKVVIP